MVGFPIYHRESTLWLDDARFQVMIAWNFQIPILHGSYKLEKLAYRTCWILGRSGKHQFLRDQDDGKLPLLVQMVNDCGNLRFM